MSVGPGADQLSFVLSFFAACMRVLVERIGDKPSPAFSLHANYGEEFTRTFLIDRGIALSGLPTPHPLHVHQFAERVFAWIESLRWAEPGLHHCEGISFAELGFAFACETSFMVPVQDTRTHVWSIPEGDTVQTSAFKLSTPMF